MSTPDAARWLVPRQLWLVPRGETTWESAGRLAGHDERPLLTARGMHQAQAYARLLAGAPVTRVVAADLRPDLQTARPVARAARVPVTAEPCLRGRRFGVADGAPRRSVGPTLSGVDGGWVVDADAAPPGGESVRDLYRRVSRFVAELLGGQLDGDLVLVAEREVVGVAMAWLDGIGPPGMSWPAAGDDRVIGRTVRVPMPLVAPAPVPGPGSAPPVPPLPGPRPTLARPDGLMTA